MNFKTLLLFSLFFCSGHFFANGQTFCPTNIDFELGTTADWNYFRGEATGTATTGPFYTLTSCAPIPGMHALTSGGTTDHYGGFPIVAPGGGAYSMKLGHDTTNNCAERARYYVDIPSGSTTYSLVYHYAAVLENPTGTGHTAYQMPRLVVDAYDSTTGTPISCISYTYVASSTLPGFIHSTVTSTVAGNGTDVYYKPWTTGNMKFPGLNGQTVAVEFTANGCTLGGHFGYGYIDMSCGLFAISTVTCATSTATLSAPPGYSSYQWNDSATFSTSYGTTQTVTVSVPTVTTTYAVICTPYSGYGCTDTLYTKLVPTSLTTAPSDDTAICSGASVSLSPNATDISTPLTYSWAPSTGLSCTTCGTVTATPGVTTAYSVTTTDAGGCLHTNVITVTVYPTPATITAPATVCIGPTATLSDAVTGGHWASSNTSIATIGSTSGVAGGVAAGTATITYSFGSGLCATSATVSVNPLPSAISGTATVCAGLTTALSDPSGTGTWTSSNTTVATAGLSTGVVGGVLSGTSTITYTASTGCTKTIIVTVNPLPSAISGTASVCAGATTTLSDGGSGTWSSGATAIATVSGSGNVSGVSTGIAPITYTLPTTCYITNSVTVNTAPLPISGTMNLCISGTTLLSDATTGGFWISPPGGSIATISSTGTVSGAAMGTTTITYTAPGGCQAFAIVTVNPFPGPIIGVSGLCAGTTATMSDLGGGAWSSSNLSAATIDPVTGMITGVVVAGGTDTVIYTLPTGCTTSIPVNIYPLPVVITGSPIVCVGSTVTLSDTSPFGTWISDNPSIASIDIFAGAVTGVSSGTATISYILPSGCQVTTVATVNPLPLPITGPNTVCAGATITLSDAATGGAWGSSNSGIASVDIASGVVTGGAVTSPGSIVITYTLPTGCSGTSGMTIYPIPPLIGGTFHVCVGQSVFLSDGSGGGTWTAANGNATVALSLGILTGVLPGTDTITYAIGTGCSTSIVATVNSSPGAIMGTPSACIGSTTVLSDAGGGSWTSSNPSVATAGLTTGTVTGALAGTSIITYSLGGTCVSTITVTINSLPPLSTVSGGGSYCAGGSGVHVYCGPPGSAISYQLFSGGLPMGSPITGTGATLDFGLQTTAGVYTVVATNPVTGCSRTMTGSATVAINPAPAAYAITGGGSFCMGGTGLHLGLGGSNVGISYQLLLGGGLAGTTVAGTGSPLDFGLFTGAGTYTVVATSVGTGCVSAMPGSATITINPLPVPYSITGGGAYCAGSTAPHIFLSGSAAGVSYQLLSGASLSGTPVAGTGSTLDFGLHSAAGTYTVIATNSATSCTAAMTGSVTVTVNPVPTITGPTAVCVGAFIIETVPGFTGGTWNSSVTSVATISSTGIVYGVLTGSTSTISYVATTGCTSATVITVSSSPGAIIGPATVCQGSSVKDSDIVTGGSWASSNTAIATAGALTGFVYGVATGSVTITYSLGSGCTVTKITTVVAGPAVITGTPGLCAGTSTSLSDATSGGTWSSSNTAIATVVAGTGVAWGVSAGTATIYYAAGGCSSSYLITVNGTPGIISGPSVVCSGLTITESDAITGGTWTSSVMTAATINASSGVVTGVATGTTIITYFLGGAGCAATRIVTVTAGPAPISGAAGLCLGASTSLGETSGGGAWSSSATGIATVTGTGAVTGLSIGTATVIYSLGGCTASVIMTINPAPGAITGPPSVCSGSVAAFSDPVGGGTWTSSSTLIATIDGSGGVWGVSPGGTATITYSLGGSCTVTKTISVDPISPITGSMGVCVGSTTPLSDGTSGGTWLSGNSTVATISGSGIVHGLYSGTSVITYTMSSGCGVTAIVAVNTAPSAIAGVMHLCAGSCTPLSDLAGGGTWSCGTAIVTVDPVGGLVCGVSAGTSTITYSLGFGCTTSTVVTIDPLPSAITGVMHLCVSSSVTLNDVTTGGTWSSGSTGVATTNPATGTVFGVAPGTSGITYSLATGCSLTAVVTVNALPQPITGAGSLCAGSATTLFSVTSGGTWASSSASIATADPLTGMITGVSPGPVTITYILPAGCEAISTMTINSAPPPISGTTTTCVSSATVLSDLVTGGVWASSNTVIAVVSGTGVVSGSALGTATISYLVSGCPATTVVTVNSAPGAVAGPVNVCAGSSITLTDSPDGGSWSSSLPGVAAIDETAGIVTGGLAGTATITYSVGTGCSVTATVTVDALPAPITGTPQVCLGFTTTLSDASGGAWSSSNSTLASINGAGIVTGLEGGAATISYTNSNGCVATRMTTVIAVPAILGVDNMCAFGTPLNVYDSLAGGFWTSTLASISSSGVVTAYSAGEATITYTLTSGCFTTSTLTINPMPGPVTGLSHLCLGQSMTVSDTSAGGTWSSSNSAVAPIGSGGFVNGLTPGTSTISYSIASGCTTSETITVYPHPSVIAGAANVCVASTMPLNDTVAGGAWSSSNPLIAAIAATGVVTGATAGVAVVTYSLAASCSATKLITVNPLPAAFAVTGGGSYCEGGPGVHIGLSGSNTGIVYRLYHGGSLMGTVSGTGIAPDFGLQTTAGVYTAVATNTSTTCVNNMPGSAVISVPPIVIPIVNIAVSPDDSICAGTPVTFSATAIFGGSSPAYQWAVNGSAMGSTTHTYSYTPANEDIVSVQLISNANCASPDTVYNSVTMTVVTPLPLLVNITADPGTTIKAGDSISFTAAVINGSSALTYQWVVNTTQIPGATTAAYGNNNFANGDSVSCMVTSTGFCNIAGSGSAIITVNNNAGSGVRPVGAGGDISVLPNPNKGIFTVKGNFGNNADGEVSLEMTNLLGQIVYKSNVMTQNGKINAQVMPGNSLPNGIYLLNLRTESEYRVFHIVIEQ